jgi:hypothetical protein
MAGARRTRTLTVALSALALLAWAPGARAHGDIPLAEMCKPQADPPAGLISATDNVEYLGSLPGEAGDMAAGGRLVGRYFYLTALSHFSIYDASRPEAPKLVSRVDFPCRFENEDVDISPDGSFLIYSDFATTGDLYVRPRQGAP